MAEKLKLTYDPAIGPDQSVWSIYRGRKLIAQYGNENHAMLYWNVVCSQAELELECDQEQPKPKGGPMTSDQIIAKLLPLDGEEFRRAIWKYKCVQDNTCPPIEGSVWWIDGFDGSLVELAFELRDKAVAADHTKYRDVRYEIGRIVQDNYSSYWACDYAQPKHYIVAAIAAIEGVE